MKYMTTVHLSPTDLVEIISQHLSIENAQVHFKVETRQDGPGQHALVFTGADVKVSKSDSDLRSPPKPNK